MEEILLNEGGKLAKTVLKYLFDQIKDKANDILTKKLNPNKKPLIDEVAEEDTDELLSNIKEIIESKDYYQNEPIFKKFKDEEIKSIINEMFVEEKIDEKIKEKIKMEMKDFQISDGNILNVLLINKEKKEIKSFEESLNKLNFIKDKNDCINIDIKDSLIKMKKIKFIYESNDKYDCLWDFDKGKKEDLDILEKNINIPIIYIYFKNSLSSEKILLINNFDKKYIKYYNNHIIDIDNKQNLLNLFEKSMINILIKDYKNKIEKKSNEISDIMLSRIKFESGNEINKIAILNNSLIQAIFKKFVFQDKLSDSSKRKCWEILSIYQKYIEDRKKSYLSKFITTCSNELIIKLRNKINKEGEINGEIDKKKILFINEISNGKNNDLNNSQNIGIKTAYFDNTSKELERMFEDYFLHKASMFINLLVIKCIKEIINDYYETLIIQYFYDIHKDDYVLED